MVHKYREKLLQNDLQQPYCRNKDCVDSVALFLQNTPPVLVHYKLHLC